MENIFNINMNVFVGSDVIVRRSYAEAIELLKNIVNINLIITVDKIGDVEVAKALHTWLGENKVETALIILTKDKGYELYGTVIDPELDIKDIIAICAKLLGISQKEMNRDIISEFYAIPTFYFSLLETCCCDIFRRSSGSGEPGDAVYFKVFDANKKLDKNEIEKLMKSNMKSLYVLTGMRKKFVNYFTEKIIKKMKEAQTEDKKFQSLEGAREVIAHQIQKYGITEDTVKIADTAVAETFKAISNISDFKNFIKFISTNASSYIFKHSQIATYISYHIIDHMEWGTSEQKQKLTFDTFFHHIVFTDDKLAKIHGQEELNHADLDKSEKDLILRHAVLAAEITQKYPRYPMGADIIIKQHHGTYNGIGFNQSPGTDLSPLTAVFMIAEEFSRILLDNQSITVEKIIEKLKVFFPKHHKFETAIETLKEKSLKI